MRTSFVGTFTRNIVLNETFFAERVRECMRVLVQRVWVEGCVPSRGNECESSASK